MNPVSVSNGDGDRDGDNEIPHLNNGMPMTEYSASPSPGTIQSVNSLPASSSVPPTFLLPDGHPDVSI